MQGHLAYRGKEVESTITENKRSKVGKERVLKIVTEEAFRLTFKRETRTGTMALFIIMCTSANIYSYYG